jgi:Mce-associated membrane protein
VISCFPVHDPEGPDAGRCDDPADVTDPDGPRSRSGIDSGSVGPTDSEDEVAAAEARAEAARVRLAQLRRTAETGDAEHGTESPAAGQQPAKWTRTQLRLRRPRWLRRPGRKTVAVGAGVVLASASLGATGYMLWQHHTAVHKRQLTAELSVAARQGITALMSIDPAHAKDGVQSMIDASTGDLKSQLSVMSALMVKKAEDTKVGSKVTVEAVAVESVGADSGVVLVAAKTDAFGPDNAKPPPALFRLSVKLDRDGGQLKMSKIEFLS